MAGVLSGIAAFEKAEAAIDAEVCRDNAQRFSIHRFRREYSVLVMSAWEERLRQ